MSQPAETVTLDQPIQRGEQTITEIALRKPMSGELRGLSLADLLNLDVNSLIKLLPRISQPTLTEQEIGRMAPADLSQLGAKVSGFLLPKALLEGSSLSE